jgi:hypothetical protein
MACLDAHLYEIEYTTVVKIISYNITNLIVYPGLVCDEKLK